MRMPPHSQPYNRAGLDQPLMLKPAAWPSAPGADAGFPAERAARIAARHAFVQMKRSFMDAALLVPGTLGDLLRVKIRGAHEPLDLWHLREVLLALLPEAGPGGTPDAGGSAASAERLAQAARCREDVQQQLQRVFVDSVTGTPRDF